MNFVARSRRDEHYFNSHKTLSPRTVTLLGSTFDKGLNSDKHFNIISDSNFRIKSAKVFSWMAT